MRTKCERCNVSYETDPNPKETAPVYRCEVPNCKTLYTESRAYGDIAYTGPSKFKLHMVV